jgi:methylenetetrahydrofolate--tRNA-(uracil-5-)-methyltransferase
MERRIGMQGKHVEFSVWTVLGGGLAGCEAALTLADAGVPVRLVEMRPVVMTGAHRTAALAELVCSNSLGSRLPDRGTGLLMAECERLGSRLLALARAHEVPAGGALAVDREAFARAVTAAVETHPRITLERAEARGWPEGPAILATGPLTSPALAEAVRVEAGGEAPMFFFDAIAPLIAGDSIDTTIAFRASRYDRGVTEEGDYLNCPFTREEYAAFVAALRAAERAPLRDFERAVDGGVAAGEGAYFERCLPIEVLAARGEDALAFGPMRPVGLRDPRTGRRPRAVLQLRREDVAGAAYNLVGFQTNLRVAEQERVFRMIPGLARAEFLRHGQMHRNTFLNAPRLLEPTLQWRGRPDRFVAGQLTGVEGYLGNIATGLLAGRNAARRAAGLEPRALPPETMLGALCAYISGAPPERFQPMKANLGLLPPLPDPVPRGKRDRAAAHAVRARQALEAALG